MIEMKPLLSPAQTVMRDLLIKRYAELNPWPLPDYPFNEDDYRIPDRILPL